MSWKRCITVTTIVWSLSLIMFNSAWAESNQQYYRRIAARAAGEASFSEDAFAAVVCTMKNRLEAGWTRDTVLHAYYAPDVVPTQRQIDIARNVLQGVRHCDPDFYYCLGLKDRWKPGTQFVHLYATTDGKQGIRLYSRH